MALSMALSVHMTSYQLKGHSNDAYYAQLSNRDRHGWTVKELLAEFERLGAEMEHEYGVV